MKFIDFFWCLTVGLSYEKIRFIFLLCAQHSRPSPLDFQIKKRYTISEIPLHTEGVIPVSPWEIFGQIIGILAVIISFLTYQMKTQRGILVMLSCATVLFCIHYACLGAMVAVVLNIVGIIRNMCYYHNDKKILSSKVVPVILAAVMGIFSIFTWEGYHSAFFVVGLMLNTLAMGYFNPQNLRKSLLLTCSLIFIYNAFTLSIGGMINETVAIISAIVGLVRFRKKKTV